MKAVPTLTTDGFVTDPSIMLIKIYEYFLSSDYSQSVSFYGNIASLPYLIREAGSDFEELKILVKDTLNKMCSRYWTNTNVEVSFTTKKISPNKHSNNINIDITIIENGKTHTLSKSVNVTDYKVKTFDEKIEYFLQGENT